MTAWIVITLVSKSATSCEHGGAHGRGRQARTGLLFAGLLACAAFLMTRCLPGAAEAARGPPERAPGPA
jgi:hypothetical protein